MGKRKEHLPLKEKGYIGATQYLYEDDYADVNFRFCQDGFFAPIENYSEITTLDFVARSYGDSSLTLLVRLEKYDNKQKGFNENASSLRRFLPAMFCFRQFIELKLKCIYMNQKRQTSIQEHRLDLLVQQLRSIGVSADYFDDAIKFIEDYEHNDPYFFRYLLNTDFVGIDTLHIPIKLLDKVKQMIVDIETKSYDLIWRR